MLFYAADWAVWRISVFLVLIGMSLGATAQTCYQLLDAQGRIIYESKTAPYSLAHPPDNDPKREVSRLRGEQLVVFRDRNCGLGRPSWSSPSVQPPKPTGAPPAAFEPSSPTPSMPRTAVQRGPEAATGRAVTPAKPLGVALSPQERFFLLLQYPRASLAVFFESIPAAFLMYLLLWGGFRVKAGSSLKVGFSGHLAGVLITILGSSAIRMFAYLTFAGRSAYSPSVETGEAAVYLLLIPGIVAAVYLGIASDNASGKDAEGSSAQDVATSADRAYEGEKTEIVGYRGRSMNERKRMILVAVGVIIALMLLFPPYIIVAGAPVRAIESGYALIFDLPRRATVDLGMLLVQWLGVVVVGGIAFFLSKDRGSS